MTREGLLKTGVIKAEARRKGGGPGGVLYDAENCSSRRRLEKGKWSKKEGK